MPKSTVMSKVTISNFLGAKEGRPLTVVLTKVDDPDVDPLKFPYAPHEIEIAASPNWAPRAAAGSVTPSHDWTGNAPGAVSVNTTQSAEPGDSARLENLLHSLMSWATTPVPSTQMPSRIGLSWGDYFYMGVMTAPKIKRVHSDPNGNALVADISFTLK